MSKTELLATNFLGAGMWHRDGRELVDLILAHYDHFNSRHKGLQPLKRVYVPEAREESEE